MTGTTPDLRRFYFKIPSANVLECVWALSLTDAKAKAAADWLPFWDEIEWIDPQHITRTING